MGVGALAGCSSAATLNTAEVETAIVDGLREQFPERTFTASCPSEVVAEAGGVFSCDVTDGSDGTVAIVTVTQADDQGSIQWTVTELVADNASPAPTASSSS